MTTRRMGPVRWRISWRGLIAGIQVIHRAGKLGLGAAYAAGFGRALASGTELMSRMDADFSHDRVMFRRLSTAQDGTT